MSKSLVKILGLFVAFLLLGSSLRIEQPRYPVMRPDLETWVEWQKEYLAAPEAKIDKRIDSMLKRAEVMDYGTSMDLLGNIEYVPNQRNQGGCGNCWVWAGTGVMEIAHDVQDGVFDRLSIQYFNSCRVGYACCGGNLGAFATWYSGQGLAIPWDNTNAAFADAGRGCGDGSSLVTCASISTTPSYPLVSISEASIDTHSGQAQAISNIKNILNQNKGIYFGFALPDSGAWGDFFDYWDGVGGETEATLWPDTDAYCGDEWNEAPGQAGGHAVVILGYNDDDADPANHYWLALNSWGTAGGVRPNGLFRIPMQMNYDCVYPDTNNGQSFWAFAFQTLNVDFGNSLPISDAGGPYSVACEGATTAVQLDGSNSSDLESDVLSFSWSTDCPDGSFDNAASETPVLTVNTSPGCSVACNVSLTVTDGASDTSSDTTSVAISDTQAPVLSCPADVTVECDESTDPLSTGYALASDGCDPAPVISYVDVETAGACPEGMTISRTWTATDYCGHSSSCVQTISVVDTTPPQLFGVPADETVECDAVPSPPPVTATDNCDPDPIVSFSELRTDGACANSYTLTRTWTGVDSCNNSSSAEQIITVEDTTAPVIACNAPDTIIPPDAPIAFTATAIDNCDEDAFVEITGFDCFTFTKKGKRIDKTKSCVVSLAGNRITILDSGGVGTYITWNVRAVDNCGNVSQKVCKVHVIRKGR
ncbi:MAG: C1 family peptidase [Anaerolineales bacterium]|nr:C1 family peptidase [Anaerolineales bacterium]